MRKLLCFLLAIFLAYFFVGHIFVNPIGVLLLLEESVVENQQIDNRTRDIGIGEVEDCPEEVVVVIDEKTKPIGYAIPLKQWEVEHIYNLAHQERAVTLAQRGHRKRSRGCENHTIE